MVRRCGWMLVGAGLLWWSAAFGEPAPAAAAQAASAARPRIGLVLSGGGARGLAHVGVLKVLEREGVPIDVIAGTSMGAIIGGLYASGVTAEQLEAQLLGIDWDGLFASRVDRQDLSQRRKEEDFEIATALEIGMRNGQLRLPLGALSGRGLESLLRRYTLPVRGVRNFDALPMPFRAVATDMENGEAVVLGDGDLALALRASMSVPGLFPPTEVNGRILGDGGLVDNLPVGVARAMGADIVIAVDIATPLAGRETLSSVGGLTSQMITILTEQNVQRSVASLRDADVLIRPDLGALTSTDFARTRELIASGERGAQQLAQRLAALSLGADGHARWRAALHTFPTPQARIGFIRFEGTEVTNPQRFVEQLESRPGQPFDAARAERDAQHLAASGDYIRADYRLVSTPEGDGLVFDLEDKPWGPNYFRVGLDLSTDFAGNSSFNIKISHNRHWLDASGSEWRNRLQIGAVPRWFTEWYHPLNLTSGLSNDWFVAAYSDLLRKDVVDYNAATGAEQGRYNQVASRIGLDIGQPWGAFGELRFGIVHSALRSRAEILAAPLAQAGDLPLEREYGLRLGSVIDQLDYANFPQQGYRVVGEVVTGYRHTGLPERERITRVEASANGVISHGRHTLNAYALLQEADGTEIGPLGRYTLGGFQQLSGYRPGQFDGNALLLLRLIYYQRRLEVPLLTRGLFFGASLEAGNVWSAAREASLSDLRTGSSAFLGADTGIGPLYLGLTYAPRGSWGVVLFIGRP
jgi:NTE family protein